MHITYNRWFDIHAASAGRTLDPPGAVASTIRCSWQSSRLCTPDGTGLLSTGKACRQYRGSDITFLAEMGRKYGFDALRDVLLFPSTSKDHRPLDRKRIRQIATALAQLYRPLAQPAWFPPFMVEDLSSSLAPGCAPRGTKEELSQRVEQFLFASPAVQRRSTAQVKEDLFHSQLAREDPETSGILSVQQRLALFAFICGCRHLPTSCLNRSLPVVSCAPRIESSLSSRQIALGSLPLVMQLQLLDYAVASQTGYARPINAFVQRLLEAKGLPKPESYFDSQLAGLLSQVDSRLYWIGEHLYSDLGLSMHLVQRCFAHGKRELSLVFGGFTSHLPHRQLFTAILPNILNLCINKCGALYVQAAQVAQQVALYAREQGFARVTLSGHSLGGGLAEYALLKNPQLFDQVIVFQPFHVLGQPAQIFAKHPKLGRKVTEVVVPHDWCTPRWRKFTLPHTRIVMLPAQLLLQKVHNHYHFHLLQQVLTHLAQVVRTDKMTPPARKHLTPFRRSFLSWCLKVGYNRFHQCRTVVDKA